MIRDLPLPEGWNRQHTLYYRNWYKPGTTQKLWHDSAAMIVPIRIGRHIMLHRHILPGGVLPGELSKSNIAPAGILPSESLSGYGLALNDDLETDSQGYTHYQAFVLVCDSLRSLAQTRNRRSLAREAGRMVDFFDDQMEYLEELPDIKRI